MLSLEGACRTIDGPCVHGETVMMTGKAREEEEVGKDTRWAVVLVMSEHGQRSMPRRLQQEAPLVSAEKGH